MAITAAKRSLRIRAAAEAFEILRAGNSPKVSNAELLKHAVRSDHEPHPRVVRAVFEALIEAQAAAKPKEQPTVLKKISGVFSRKAKPPDSLVDGVVQRFEQAFVQPD